MRRTDWRFWSALFAAVIFLNHSAAADCETPRDPEARIADCTQRIDSGKWKGRDQAANYTRRGNGYRDRNDLDHAIADYNEAIRIDPGLTLAFLGRGIAFSDKGDNDRAIADFSEAIRLDPKFARAYTNRGIVFRDKGDLDRAIADYSEAIRLDPEDAMAFTSRGIAYHAKGDNDRAIADFNEAIRLDPKDAMRLPRPRLSPIATRATTIAPSPTSTRRSGSIPNTPRPTSIEAVAYRDKGDNDRAIADYNEAIRLDPERATAFLNRG